MNLLETKVKTLHQLTSTYHLCNGNLKPIIQFTTSFIVTTYTILVCPCYFLPGTAGRVVQIGSKLLIGLRIYDSGTPLLSHLRLYPSSKVDFKNELELGQILFSHAIPWSPGSVLPYTMRILLSVKPFHTCPPPPQTRRRPR